MNKRNPRFTIPSLLFLFVLLALACRFSPANLLPSRTTGLQFEPRAADGTVSGSYQYSGSAGKETLQFSASADGLATFRLENAPESEMLIVNSKPDQLPHLIWQGQDVDGLGALSSEEQAALVDLLKGDLAHGLAMIPMDMACQGADAVTPAQVAALLFPLQMRFKYLTADRSALAAGLAALTHCDYDLEEGEPNQHPAVILMTPADPVPVVLGYFPFDEIGALEPAATGAGVKLASFGDSLRVDFSIIPSSNPFGPDPIQNEWGPCEAKCRGACGPDCTHNNCKFYIDDRCEKNQDGENDGTSSLVQVYECGTHPACIEHDACYDDCNRRHGCGTFAAAVCRHAGVLDPTTAMAALFGLNISCDRKVLNTYPYGDVEDWYLGYGPQPNMQTYEYHLKEYRYVEDPINCPRPDQVKDEPSPGAPLDESILQGDVYKGTADFYYMKDNPRVDNYTSEVEVTVAENGQLTGSVSVHLLQPYEGYDDCKGYWDTSIEVTLSGQLINGYGVFESTLHYLSINNYSNCENATPKMEGSTTQYITVQMIGDTITGIAQQLPTDEEGKFLYGFTAIKQ